MDTVTVPVGADVRILYSIYSYFLFMGKSLVPIEPFLLLHRPLARLQGYDSQIALQCPVTVPQQPHAHTASTSSYL